MRLVFMLTTMNFAVFFKDLTVMFQLTGPMYGLILQVILPVAFYVKSYNKKMFESYDFLKEEDLEEHKSLLHPREDRVMISNKLIEKVNEAR